MITEKEIEKAATKYGLSSKRELVVCQACSEKTVWISYKETFAAGVYWAIQKEQERAKALFETIEGILWIDKCRCDEAYTSRDLHEPNKYCAELDPLRDALKKYRGEE